VFSPEVFAEIRDSRISCCPMKGTLRNRRFSERALFEKDILVEEIGRFTGCKLINAMRSPDEESLIPVSIII